MCVYTVPNHYKKAPIQAKKRTYVRNQAKNTGKTPKNEALVCVWVGSRIICECFDYAKNQTPYNAYMKFSTSPHPFRIHIHT